MSAQSWVTATDVAQHLGVVKSTIYRWRECKVLHAHKIGQLWKFGSLKLMNGCARATPITTQRTVANKNESTEGKYRVSLAGQLLEQKSLQAVTGKTADWNEIARHSAAFANVSGKPLLVWYLVQSAGCTQATRYFVDPGLQSYSESAISDIHQRIGGEIHPERVRRALEELIERGAVRFEGNYRWRRYWAAT
jgi:hypothetical protein